MFNRKNLTALSLAALIALAPLVPASATGNENVSPGHTVSWSGESNKTHHFSHAQFIPDALPSSGKLRLGIELRRSGSSAAVARAAIDSTGKLFVDIVNAAGQTVKSADTGTVVTANERIYVETEMLGGNPGKVTVRAWKQGQSRPNWQLKDWSVNVGSTNGSTKPTAYLSGSANNTISVNNDVFWVRDAPFVDGVIGGTSISASSGNHLVTSSTSASFFTAGGDCSIDGAPFSSCGGAHGTEVNLNGLSYGTHTLTVKNQANGATQSVAWHVRPDTYGNTKPTQDTTGVPANMPLTIMDGSEDGNPDGILKIDTTANPHLANLDGKHIKAKVKILKGNVTITRSRIEPVQPLTSGNSSVAFAVWLDNVHANQASATIRDTSIHWGPQLIQDHPYSARIEGIRGANVTAERVHIYNVVDAVGVRGNGVNIKGSLFNNAYEGTDPQQPDNITHNDGVQFHEGYNTTIQGNNIKGYRNAALMIKPELNTVSNVNVSKNWLDNGACTINEAPKSPHVITGLTITNNRFGMNNALTPGSTSSPCINHDSFGVMDMNSGYTISGNTRDDQPGVTAKMWNSATHSLVG